MRINYFDWDALSSRFDRLRSHLNGGAVLLVVALLTLIVANSPLAGIYNEFFSMPLSLTIGGFDLLATRHGTMTLLDAVNDGLMTVFFFSVGLEIKREVLVGELTSVRKAMLPIIAACGGMIVPVLVFSLIAPSEPESIMRGCAIPMATDIAFSLGVLSLLGKRVPLSLKIFLTTLAVADDIGGILVIALFYSGNLEISYLLWSLIPLAILFLGGRIGIYSRLFYLSFGFIVWYLFMHSGIHATISGVIVAFMVPARPRTEVWHFVDKIRKLLNKFPAHQPTDERYQMLTNSEIRLLKDVENNANYIVSPLQNFYEFLDPLVNFLIMPVFAFANAGVTFSGISFGALMGLPFTVAMALLIGKMLGIFSFTVISIKSGWLKMPNKMNYRNLWGVSILGGIGFTVSLFIANLSYGSVSHTLLNEAKLGIISGSVLAGIIGYFVLNKILNPIEPNTKVVKKNESVTE